MRTALALIAVLAVSFLLTPGTGAGAEEKAALKLHFEKGQELTLTTSVAETTTTWWNDEEGQLENTTSMTTLLDVTGVDDDGTATMKVTIKSIALKSDSGRWSYDYDSENPPDEVPPPAAAFAAIVGKSFTMRLTAGGEVAGFEGVDKMLEETQSTLPSDERRRRWGSDRLARSFSEEALKQTFDGIFGFLPDEPVAVGDSWTRTIAVDHGIPVTAEEKYTLTERKDGTATITLEGKLKPQENAAPRRMGRGTVKHDVTGTEKGTLTVDEAAGCVFKSAITEKLEGKITMSGFRGDNTERSTDVKSEATITVETKQQPEKEAEEKTETEEKPEAE
jgi:hypothetical protein